MKPPRMVEDGRAEAVEVPRDLHSLLSSPGRDFLIRNNGDQVQKKKKMNNRISLLFVVCAESVFLCDYLGELSLLLFDTVT